MEQNESEIDTYTYVAEWIAIKIKEKKLTYRRLSLETGVSTSTIQRIMSSDGSEIRKSTLVKLEKLFGEYKPNRMSPMYNSMIAPLSMTLDEFDSVWFQCNNACPICLGEMNDINNAHVVYINRYRLKDIAQSQTSCYEDGSVVFTCKRCLDFIEKTAEMNYPSIINCIIADGPNKITVYSVDQNKQVDITNQSLLADKIGVSQPTISRLSSRAYNKDLSSYPRTVNKRNVIDIIEPKIARDLHILCAKRLSNKDFTLPLTIKNNQVIHHLTHYIQQDIGYHKQGFIRDFRIESINRPRIQCDLMVLNEAGEKHICCFIVHSDPVYNYDSSSEGKEQSEDLKNYYIGLGISFNTQYILIYYANENYQYGWGSYVAYQVIRNNAEIRVEGIREIPYFSMDERY